MNIVRMTPQELLAIRLRFKMSHGEFAKYLGVGRNCIKAWQSGKSEVPISFRIMKKLGNFRMSDIEIKKLTEVNKSNTIT